MSSQLGLKLSDFPFLEKGVNKAYPNKIDNAFFYTYAHTNYGIKYIKRNYQLSISDLRSDIASSIGVKNAGAEFRSDIKLWTGDYCSDDKAISYVYEWGAEDRGDPDYAPNKFGDLKNTVYFVNNAPIPMEEVEQDPHVESFKVVDKAYVDERHNGKITIKCTDSVILRPYSAIYDFDSVPETVNVDTTNIKNEKSLSWIVRIPREEFNSITFTVNGEEIEVSQASFAEVSSEHNIILFETTNGVTTQIVSVSSFELNDIYKKLSALDDSLTSEISERQSADKDIKDTISSLSSKTNKKFNELEKEVDGINTSISEVKETLDTKVDKDDFNSLSSNIGDIEKSLSDLSDVVDTKASQEYADGIAKDLSELDGRVTEVEKDVEGIHTTIDGLTNTIHNISDTLETKADQNAVSGLTESVGHIQKEINEIEDALLTKANKTELDELSELVGTKASKEELNSSVEELNQSIATKTDKTDFDSLENRVNDLSSELDTKADDSRVSGLESDLLDVKGLVSDVNVKELEGRVITNEGNINNIQSTLEQKANVTDIPEVISELEHDDTEKAVSSKAVEDWVKSQDYADSQDVSNFTSRLDDLEGQLEDIDKDNNLPKLSTFLGSEEVSSENKNTLKDITNAIDGLVATNFPVQQEIQNDEPESTYAVSSKAVVGAIEEHAEDNSLHLENNQAELIEAFFGSRQPDGTIEDGESLDSIVEKLEEIDTINDKVSQIETNVSKVEKDLSEAKESIPSEDDLKGYIDEKVGELDVVTNESLESSIESKLDEIKDDFVTNDSLGSILDERLKDINKVEVDQTYNPISSNPQSGTAVAEAISSINIPTVEQSVTSGSTNAVSSKAVYDYIEDKDFVSSDDIEQLKKDVAELKKNPVIVICQSEDELPSAGEQKAGVIYAVLKK